MAQTDINLIFTGGNTGSAQAITSSTVISTGIYDLATGLMNTGSTYATSPINDGNATYYGEDLGIGPKRLMMYAAIGTAFAGGTSLNIAIQAAVDTQGSGNFSGLTFQTIAETGAIPLANLTASNSYIPLPDIPRRAAGQKLYRFLQLAYIPVGTFTAGTISFAGMVSERPDFQTGPAYAGNFTVGA